MQERASTQAEILFFAQIPQRIAFCFDDRKLPVSGQDGFSNKK
jgi:hypothetical protein